MEPRVVVLVE